MTPNLNGRIFVPVENSAGGAVTAGTRFVFSQDGSAITASYSGDGITDGHIVGRMTGRDIAELLYHCRKPDGSLAAGEACATFGRDADGLTIAMAWHWLNGPGDGHSFYREVTA